MLATIKTCGTGTCVWCMSRGEGVQAQFSDGLQGFFCMKDFRVALKARSDQKEEQHAAESTATGRSS